MERTMSSHYSGEGEKFLKNFFWYICEEICKMTSEVFSKKMFFFRFYKLFGNVSPCLQFTKSSKYGIIITFFFLQL